jgi:hypothetical protein
MTKVDIIIRRL